MTVGILSGVVQDFLEKLDIDKVALWKAGAVEPNLFSALKMYFISARNLSNGQSMSHAIICNNIMRQIPTVFNK